MEALNRPYAYNLPTAGTFLDDMPFIDRPEKGVRYPQDGDLFAFIERPLAVHLDQVPALQKFAYENFPGCHCQKRDPWLLRDFGADFGCFRGAGLIGSADAGSGISSGGSSAIGAGVGPDLFGAVGFTCGGGSTASGSRSVRSSSMIGNLHPPIPSTIRTWPWRLITTTSSPARPKTLRGGRADLISCLRTGIR